MGVEDVPVAVVEIDDQNRVVALNAVAREVLGDADLLSGATDPSDHQRLHGHLAHVRASDAQQRTHLELVIGGSPMLMTSSRLGTGSVICVLTEIASLHSRIQDLEQRAFTDALTGLANRSLFVRMLDQSLRGAERSSARTAVLFIDIDNFKAVNDAHGHATGDAVLVEMAGRLRSAVRSTDLVARVGGDEFVILAPDMDVPEAELIAKRVLALCSAPVHLDGATLDVTVSVGVHVEDPGADPLPAMGKADTAMYAAKAGGRAISVTWTPQLSEAPAGREPTELADLQKANRELRVRIEQVKQESRLDARTGLLRDQVYEELVRSLADAGVDFSVVFVDVDLFHEYNERYTHLVGHRTLGQLGAALTTYAGSLGTVFRYGGEEFTLVLLRSDIGQHEAEDLAMRLPAFVEDLDMAYDTSPFGHVTVSVGIAHTEQGADVTASANVAMLDAKRAGRNRTRVHQSEP